MSAQVIGFELKKGLNQNQKNRFLSSNDFSAAISSDAELINRLGFSSRAKKRGVKSRAEDDYLGCYRFYITSEMEVCKKNNDSYSLTILSKAFSILSYLINQKKFFENFNKYKTLFSEKQSIMLAKLKSAIRSIIVEYSMINTGYSYGRIAA